MFENVFLFRWVKYIVNVVLLMNQNNSNKSVKKKIEKDLYFLVVRDSHLSDSLIHSIFLTSSQFLW